MDRIPVFPMLHIAPQIFPSSDNSFLTRELRVIVTLAGNRDRARTNSTTVS